MSDLKDILEQGAPTRTHAWLPSHSGCVTWLGSGDVCGLQTENIVSHSVPSRGFRGGVLF